MEQITLNTSQKLLLAGMVLACFGPYIGYFSFLCIALSAFSCKVEARKYMLLFVVSSILILCSVHSLFVYSNFDLLSFIVALITFSILLLVSSSSLILISQRVIVVASITVPIALVIAIIQTLGLYPLEFRGNEVLGLMRFTFLFAEPSHYSLVLALCSLIAIISPTHPLIRCLLFVGLLLTWSLSGFCIFILGYIGYKFYTRGILKSFFISMLLCVVLLYLWFFWLQNSTFWLVSKIESIIDLYSGNTIGASSAMLRYNSIILGPYFLIRNISSGNEWISLLGMGFGNVSEWVQSYYKLNYALPEITDANNIISNVLISNGLVGLICYFFACTHYAGLNFNKVFVSIMMLVILSLFSGYAFGPFAVLTLLLTRIYILLVINDGNFIKH